MLRRLGGTEKRNPRGHYHPAPEMSDGIGKKLYASCDTALQKPWQYSVGFCLRPRVIKPTTEAPGWDPWLLLLLPMHPQCTALAPGHQAAGRPRSPMKPHSPQHPAEHSHSNPQLQLQPQAPHLAEPQLLLELPRGLCVWLHFRRAHRQQGAVLTKREAAPAVNARAHAPANAPQMLRQSPPSDTPHPKGAPMPVV